MAQIDGQLYFAPEILMKDLDFADPERLLFAFSSRTEGLFLDPIRTLEHADGGEHGALFAAALLAAALIESLARIETGSDEKGTLIRQWLEDHIPSFKAQVTINSQQESLANVFESRFRNGLAHNGYIANRANNK